VGLAPPPVDMEMVPRNCIFELDDIAPGLPHYEGLFDVVHCRMIGAGLRDCRQSKLDVEACLKPGGILIWTDVDYDLIAENMVDFVERASDTKEGGSWVARMLYGECIFLSHVIFLNMVFACRDGPGCHLDPG
jgi:hypothetical protein